MEVLRTLRRACEEIDVVRLPDGLEIAVPRWMLDPLTCSQLPQEARPRVALNALLRLAEIAQGGRLSVEAGASLCGTSTSTKDNVSRKPPARLHQTQQPFAKKTLWDRFPEATRIRCCKALIELLQRPVLHDATGENSHERQD
ncbi:MAG: hypothetical protein WBV90_10205 [Terrimicrobiaceae bacterium]